MKINNERKYPIVIGEEIPKTPGELKYKLEYHIEEYIFIKPQKEQGIIEAIAVLDVIHTVLVKRLMEDTDGNITKQIRHDVLDYGTKRSDSY